MRMMEGIKKSIAFLVILAELLLLFSTTSAGTALAEPDVPTDSINTKNPETAASTNFSSSGGTPTPSADNPWKMSSQTEGATQQLVVTYTNSGGKSYTFERSNYSANDFNFNGTKDSAAAWLSTINFGQVLIYLITQEFEGSQQQQFVFKNRALAFSLTSTNGEFTGCTKAESAASTDFSGASSSTTDTTSANVAAGIYGGGTTTTNKYAGEEVAFGNNGALCFMTSQANPISALPITDTQKSSLNEILQATSKLDKQGIDSLRTAAPKPQALSACQKKVSVIKQPVTSGAVNNAELQEALTKLRKEMLDTTKSNEKIKPWIDKLFGTNTTVSADKIKDLIPAATDKSLYSNFYSSKTPANYPNVFISRDLMMKLSDMNIELKTLFAGATDRPELTNFTVNVLRNIGVAAAGGASGAAVGGVTANPIGIAIGGVAGSIIGIVGLYASRETFDGTESEFKQVIQKALEITLATYYMNENNRFNQCLADNGDTGYGKPQADLPKLLESYAANAAETAANAVPESSVCTIKGSGTTIGNAIKESFCNLFGMFYDFAKVVYGKGRDILSASIGVQLQ